MHWNQQCEISHFPGESCFYLHKFMLCVRPCMAAVYNVCFLLSAGDAVSVLWRDRSAAHQEHRCDGGSVIIISVTAEWTIKLNEPLICEQVYSLEVICAYYLRSDIKQTLNFNLSCCVFVFYHSASVCSQVFPVGGSAETLWDYLHQEHKHRDVCGDLQPHQGAKKIRPEWKHPQEHDRTVQTETMHGNTLKFPSL